MTALLPQAFQDLEPYAQKWVLPNEEARYKERLKTSMEELQVFYDTFLPRGEEIKQYLDSFELQSLPEKEFNLLRLFYAWIIASFPIESFHQPQIPDTGAAEFYFHIEPVP